MTTSNIPGALALGLALMGVVVGLSACKADECQRMMACCAAVKDMEGVGPRACGPLAEAARDPDTCRSVNQTVRFMLEDRKQPVPEVCE